jgi:hypothetical protein
LTTQNQATKKTMNTTTKTKATRGECQNCHARKATAHGCYRGGEICDVCRAASQISHTSVADGLQSLTYTDDVEVLRQALTDVLAEENPRKGLVQRIRGKLEREERKAGEDGGRRTEDGGLKP